MSSRNLYWAALQVAAIALGVWGGVCLFRAVTG